MDFYRFLGKLGLVVMGLMGFKYIRGYRVVVLIIILVFSSMLFSVMAFSLLGFYKGFSGYLGEEKDVVVVYDRGSSTPFTGLVPAYLVRNISSIKGVVAVSPEVIVPCVLRNESIFLRGVIPEDFIKLDRLVVIKGGMLKFDDLSSMIVGRGLAERLNLRLNDKVLVLSVLTGQYVELEVKGIFVSGSVMDDEVIAPLYVGQWLRGSGYDYVTLIRVKVDSSVVSPSVIFKAITAKSSEVSLSNNGVQSWGGFIISWSRPGFSVESVGVNEVQRFMEGYLNRYGITRESLIILSVIVFFFSSVVIMVASKTVLVQYRGEISVLRSLGVSRRVLKLDLFVRLLFWSLVASSVGIVLGVVILAIIQSYGFLQVLSHTVPVEFDPFIVIINFILVFVIILMVVFKSELE